MTGTPLRFLCNVFLIAVLLLAVIEALPVARLGASDNSTSRSDSRLIVHEWGTFTSIAGKDGVAVEWRPLDDVSDLPGFVYQSGGLPGGKGLRNKERCDKCNIEALVRMETPVI